jgi:phosphatidyl-myo-inositol dimannoside synthase
VANLKILFLTEKTFSASGATEKTCRVAGRAMYEYSITARGEFKMYSRKDPADANTQPYLPSSVFTGFGAAKVSFLVRSVREGLKSSVIVLGSIRQLLPACLIKLIAPEKQLVLFTQGIEPWDTLSPYSKKMLQRINIIIAASNFTKEKIKELFRLPEERFVVLNNCLDPFLPELNGTTSRNEFRNSYGFSENDIVLMTISRLSIKEKMQGYEKILLAIKKLHNTWPHLKYLFVGKYDEAEKMQLDKIVHALGIEYDVTFTGFVPESIIGDYYNMADAFIVPGEKTGFGISVIEALYYNKPVITGWSDGITENLANSRLGIQIDLQSQEDVTNTIQKVISDIKAFMPDRELVLEKFSYPVYKNKLGQLLALCIT